MVDPQILLESENQLKSSGSSRDAAISTIKRAEAELLSQKAGLAKAKVEVSIAEALLGMAKSEARHLEAWVGYLNQLPGNLTWIMINATPGAIFTLNVLSAKDEGVRTMTVRRPGSHGPKSCHIAIRRRGSGPFCQPDRVFKFRVDVLSPIVGAICTEYLVLALALPPELHLIA